MGEVANGAKLLQAFLKRHGIPNSDAADAIGVSAPTIHDWLKGAKLPKTVRRKALEVWTGGAVPADSWDTRSERTALAKVQPYSSKDESGALPKDSTRARTGTDD